MKRKKLDKKIRQLESLVRKVTNKLSKLKRKLKAVATAAGNKQNRKSVNRLGGDGRSIKSAKRSKLASRYRTSKSQVERIGATEGRGKAKVKPKRSMTPEGRAKLAAGMKARWAAKRAAATAET